MKTKCLVIAITLFAFLTQAYADAPLPPQKEYAPENGKGRVVLVVSGQQGPAKYENFAKSLAELGYYAVLVDSNDFWNKEDGGGKVLLQGVIAQAQQSAHALPGKAAVIGFSLGGGVSLNFATKMKDLVCAVVVYYPATSHIKNPDSFVSKIEVPTLMLAAGRDTYQDCCVIENARKLDKAAKALNGNSMFKVVEYPYADHAFAISSEKAYREDDSKDAFRRAIDHIRQYCGE